MNEKTNKSKVVLVTGCSSGVGRELCMELKRRGYRVIASARDVSKIHDLEVDDKVVIDVTKEQMMKQAVEEIVKRYGRIDILVNNAGFSVRSAVEAISEAARNELMEYGIYVTTLEPGAMDTDFFTTLAKNSDERMKNLLSPYYNLYQRDLVSRQRQRRTDVKISVRQICNVIEKSKLKCRYQISLPFIFKILLVLPDGLKEKLILHFN